MKKKQLVVSKAYIGVVDTESDTTTGAMKSIQYSPVFKKGDGEYIIEESDAKLFRCFSTKDGMRFFNEYLAEIFKPHPRYEKTLHSNHLSQTKVERRKVILYCHNLKWDIEFFMNWLMIDEGKVHKLDYNAPHFSKSRKYLDPKTFDSLITNMGETFTIRYIYKHLDITVIDSLKIIPFGLGKAGESYNTKFKKVKVNEEDYDDDLSDEYCLNDVLCLSELIAIMIDEGINPCSSISQASWCLKDYKKKLFEDSPLGKRYQELKKDNPKALNPSKCFRHYFPRLDDKYEYAEDTSEYGVPSLDAYVRQGYRGGLTYCNPRNANVIYISKWFYDAYKDTPQIKEIIATGNYKIVNYITHLDIHSLYPSKCMFGFGNLDTFPVGKPRIKIGAPSNQLVQDYLNNKKHFMVRFSCRFKIKPNRFPSVQIKCSYYNPNEWLTSSYLNIGGVSFDYPTYLTLTDVEFYDFLDRYEVEDLVIRDHLIFDKVEKCKDLFECYMGYYYEVKANTDKDENFVKYQTYKLKLTGLTGKFGSSVIASVKVPRIDKDGSIKLETKLTDEKGNILTKESVYTPIVAWITAYGRMEILKAMDEAGQESYITGDTDSLFTATEEEFVPSLGITDNEMNTFGLEHAPEDIAMFCASRQKTYMMLTRKGKFILKVAGMTDKQKKKFITTSKSPFIDFASGNLSVSGGKKIKKSTPEGAILVDTDFKLSEKKSKISAKKVISYKMKDRPMPAPISLRERMKFDLEFRKLAIDSYKYLKSKDKFSPESLAEMLGINFELPDDFVIDVMRAAFE